MVSYLCHMRRHCLHAVVATIVGKLENATAKHGRVQSVGAHEFVARMLMVTVMVMVLVMFTMVLR